MSKSANHNMGLGMRLAYWPLGVLLGALALLPLSLLYAVVATPLAFVARCIARYRRAVVRANVRDSFPDLNKAQRRDIEKNFYRHLADYFVETVKFPHMSAKQLRARMAFADTHLVDQAIGQGRDIVLYTSHFGNWEWITTMGLWCKHADKAHFSHVYRPLRQKWFDRWFVQLRSRYNVSIPMHEVFRRLLTWRSEGKLWVCGFLSDQKPSHTGKAYTVPFMHRDTPFIGGTEQLARRLDAIVMYFDTEVVSRGHYRSTIRLLSEHPRTLPEGELTRLYASTLQNQIMRYPAAYLWSHNRWKLNKEALTDIS